MNHAEDHWPDSLLTRLGQLPDFDGQSIVASGSWSIHQGWTHASRWFAQLVPDVATP